MHDEANPSAVARGFLDVERGVLTPREAAGTYVAIGDDFFNPPRGYDDVRAYSASRLLWSSLLGVCRRRPWPRFFGKNFFGHSQCPTHANQGIRDEYDRDLRHHLGKTAFGTESLQERFATRRHDVSRNISRNEHTAERKAL